MYVESGKRNSDTKLKLMFVLSKTPNNEVSCSMPVLAQSLFAYILFPNPSVLLLSSLRSVVNPCTAAIASLL